jgi:hypothetical protein
VLSTHCAVHTQAFWTLQRAGVDQINQEALLCDNADLHTDYLADMTLLSLQQSSAELRAKVDHWVRLRCLRLLDDFGVDAIGRVLHAEHEQQVRTVTHSYITCTVVVRAVAILLPQR